MSPITTEGGHGDSPTSVLTDCSSLLLFYYKYLMHGSTMEDGNFSSVNDLLKYIPAFLALSDILSGTVRIWARNVPLMLISWNTRSPTDGTNGHSCRTFRRGNPAGEVGHGSPGPHQVQSLLSALFRCEEVRNASMLLPSWSTLPLCISLQDGINPLLLQPKSNLLPLGCSLIGIVL